jgi:hypothetical protein
MQAKLTGVIGELSVSFKRDEKHFYGPAKKMEYGLQVGPTPPSTPWSLSVYRRGSAQVSELLYVCSLNGELPREPIERFNEYQSLLMLMSAEGGDARAYLAVFMLPDDAFNEFSQFVQMHFTNECTYHLMSELHPFGIALDDRMTPTIREFERGAPYMLANPKIELIFQGSKLPRSDVRG